MHTKVDARLAAKRDAGEGGARRNASSENYNIVTLDYAKNAAGQALAAKVCAGLWALSGVDVHIQQLQLPKGRA